MGNFEDLQKIWLSEKAKDLPGLGEMRRAIAVEKNQSRRQIWVSIAAIIILLILMGYVLVFSESRLILTSVGEALMFAAIFILLTSRINSLRRSFRNENISNYEFIEKLKSNVERLTNDWNATQKTAYAFVGIGYLFFLYESVYQNRQEMIIGYSVTAIVLGAAWFFVRPFANQRKLRKTQRLLEKLEDLSRQIKE